MDEQTQLAQWLFAAEYAERFGALPPSQQREAIKRLTTRRRNPLTPEQCQQPNSPDITAALEAIMRAYSSKKERSRVASASKRQLVRAVEVEIAEPEPVVAAAELEPADAAPEPVDAAPTAEAAVIVCANEPEVVRAAPLVDAAPLAPRAKPRVPRIPIARSAAAPPLAAVPKTMPKKAVSGLAAMIAR